jgi:hypothetical protein
VNGRFRGKTIKRSCAQDKQQRIEHGTFRNTIQLLENRRLRRLQISYDEHSSKEEKNWLYFAQQHLQLDV